LPLRFEERKVFKDYKTISTMAEFNILIEEDEDGWYVASVPEIQGCYTQAKTIPQLLERIKEAIEVCLESEKGIKPLKFIGIQKIKVEQ
jgi:predicted RNase H-like HicB family nuclease